MIVTAKQLARLRHLAPSTNRPGPTPLIREVSRLNLESILQGSGIEIRKTKHEPDGRVIYEVDCLTSSEHDDGAVFTQFPDGGVDYSCLHASCADKGWQDVRRYLQMPSVSRSGVIDQSGIADSGEASAGGEPAWELIPPAMSTNDWPVLAEEAFHGLAGDVVRAISPTTEADQVATLITFLTMFGNASGRLPHIMIGDSRHGANIFAVLVGETARSRKGTSREGPQRLMARADATWAAQRVTGGLSTGEGLIWAVHDEITKFDAKTGEWEVVDPGVEDKRLLCIEEELSQVLKTTKRQGATISEIIRRAWDSRGAIQTLTKTAPSKATNAHISILGHITKAELIREITETDLANGFANRFAWFLVRRSGLLPMPPRLDDDVVDELARRIEHALSFAQNAGHISFDAEAAELWSGAYAYLERDRIGLAGAITARSSAITLRLALIYALLDESSVIRPEHLEAAVAVWDYADDSVASIFGDLTGDAVADRILSLLRAEGFMTRNDLYEAFGRNVPSVRMGQALDLLHRSGRICAWKVPSVRGDGRGRPRTVYGLPPKKGGGEDGT